MSDPLKERIKAWLKGENLSREWLAAECEVKPRTIDNWLSTPRPIPRKALLIIQRLMGETEVRPQEPQETLLSVSVDLKRFDAYNRASMTEGMTIREWMVAVLDDAAAGEEVTPPGPGEMTQRSRDEKERWRGATRKE